MCLKPSLGLNVAKPLFAAISLRVVGCFRGTDGSLISGRGVLGMREALELLAETFIFIGF